MRKLLVFYVKLNPFVPNMYQLLFDFIYVVFSFTTCQFLPVQNGEKDGTFLLLVKFSNNFSLPREIGPVSLLQSFLHPERGSDLIVLKFLICPLRLVMVVPTPKVV